MSDEKPFQFPERDEDITLVHVGMLSQLVIERMRKPLVAAKFGPFLTEVNEVCARYEVNHPLEPIGWMVMMLKTSPLNKSLVLGALTNLCGLQLVAKNAGGEVTVLHGAEAPQPPAADEPDPEDTKPSNVVRFPTKH